MGTSLDIAKAGLLWLAAHLGPYAPRLIGAATIAVLAWLVARLVRAAVGRISARTGMDARLHNPGITALLADLAHWAVWLLALPALLGALALQGLLDPVNAMLSRLLGFAQPVRHRGGAGHRRVGQADFASIDIDPVCAVPAPTPWP